MQHHESNILKNCGNVTLQTDRIALLLLVWLYDWSKMQQLTEHFSDTELGVADCWPQIVDNARQLCETLLEPIRAHCGPIIVDDGYRDPSHNQRVGGVSDSQHLYEGRNSVADIRPADPNWTMQQLFDWVRLMSALPFDQCAIEFQPGTNQPRCVHISYNGALTAQRREALIWEKNGAGAYTRVEVRP
ncbi:MAG: D-Ala-D-Ala carboxypeptidase family metallohydrolase [Terracidiphilus sp.]